MIAKPETPRRDVSTITPTSHFSLGAGLAPPCSVPSKLTIFVIILYNSPVGISVRSTVLR